MCLTKCVLMLSSAKKSDTKGANKFIAMILVHMRVFVSYVSYIFIRRTCIIIGTLVIRRVHTAKYNEYVRD